MADVTRFPDADGAKAARRAVESGDFKPDDHTDAIWSMMEAGAAEERTRRGEMTVALAALWNAGWRPQG